MWGLPTGETDRTAGRAKRSRRQSSWSQRRQTTQTKARQLTHGLTAIPVFVASGHTASRKSQTPNPKPQSPRGAGNTRHQTPNPKQTPMSQCPDPFVSWCLCGELRFGLGVLGDLGGSIPVSGPVCSWQSSNPALLTSGICLLTSDFVRRPLPHFPFPFRLLVVNSYLGSWGLGQT
jgi:hypothetical protein